MTSLPVRPILVVLDYRGGDRFRRALDSIGPAEHHFDRIILSITAPWSSPDVAIAREYLERMSDAGTPSKAEIICSGVELPTMQHQRFWIDHLARTGAGDSDWIYWLAYDDQIRLTGIDAVVDECGSWSLRPDTAYFGPWAMRHEQPDHLFDGPWDEPLESWTSFPVPGPLRLPVADWIGRQLVQPTYMQMSGSVVPFGSHRRLVTWRPVKTGPMRIEMATTAYPGTRFVEEFAEPVSIIYGRSNSDRASYGKAARKEDVHLGALLARYALTHPASLPSLTTSLAKVGTTYVKVATGRGELPAEDWVVRGTVSP
jgi:hypothetical protein